MVTPADLLALADRVGRAQGPSRELDAEIQFHLEWGDRLSIIDWVEFDDVGDYRARFTGGGTVVGGAPRRYTGSLDAALTLVPAEWKWSAGNAYYDPMPVWARVFPDRPIGQSGGTGNRYAATAALALCSAALMARAIVARNT